MGKDTSLVDSGGESPLLGFVELATAPTLDEAAVIAEAKARLAAQAEGERRAKVWELVNNKNLFTETGKFAGMSKEQLPKLLASVLTVIEQRTEDRIKCGNDGIDWEDACVEIRLAHLLRAAERGIILPDWKERIARIERATHYYYDNYSQSVIGRIRDGILEAASKIDQLSGVIPEGVTGKGLEFSPSAVGTGQNVYLNGQLVASLSAARFGAVPTNGEVVAWLTVNQIDYCTIKGSQKRWMVMAWKPGMKEPREVYEDHAYDSEGYLSLELPRVETDGTIAVLRHMDIEVTEKRLKL